MKIDQFKAALEQEEKMSELAFEQVRDSVQSKTKKFEKQIFLRDVLETLAAIFVIVFFGKLLLGDNSLITSIGILLIMAGALEIIMTLHWTRYKDSPHHEDVTLLEFLKNELKRVDRQIWLLRNITWWYIAPLITGGCLMVLGDPLSLQLSLLICCSFIAFGGFLYWFNQQAVNSELIELKKSLEEMQKELMARNECEPL